MMHERERWTRKDTELLLAMLRRGDPYAAIAEHFGRTASAIESRTNVLRRLGYRIPWRDGVNPGVSTPSRPKGMRPEQVAWARANPAHPEARMILGMHREGVIG